MAFTYPFCYIPDNKVVEESERLIKFIDGSPFLREIFAEGKMMGILITEDGTVLRAFSGLAGGRSCVEGFVPPVFDTASLEELYDPSKSPAESAALQARLFESYKVHNFLGEQKSIAEIFAALGAVPPAGTGECAAPKLLEEAYRHSLKPALMGEFWYGASPASGHVRQHGRFYPSCTGKCGPLLSFMMRGLEVDANPLQVQIPASQASVLYEDECLLVADKPSGMLCVPGKAGSTSLMELLSATHGPLLECHRLDMDTSGVIVFAKDAASQACIRTQFEKREASKSYVAHLAPTPEGVAPKRWKAGFEGTIALPLSADWDDRPRQMVDLANGKSAITRFTILSVWPDGSMDVRFQPLTGRTHQLRVHAASAGGLAHPIQGDRLYGNPTPGRLMLHAEHLEITHPATGQRMSFDSPARHPIL